VRFLGVDLAWKDGNPSGVALLGGRRFPLHLREIPRTLPSHDAVLQWIARHVAHHRAAVGVDAPLLGLDRGGRRGCDDEISRRFGRYHASTHSPPRAPALGRLARRLLRAYGREAFGPGFAPRSASPAVREVYPNALQVRLFALNRTRGLKILKYKQRRFADTRSWAADGLRPFAERCAEAIGDRYVATSDPAWAALTGERPQAGMKRHELKAIEDRWDALLCALAVALEFFEPGSMRFYCGEPGQWRGGYILAPAFEGGSLSP
jgi:predicted RNase H-like nuclease